MRDQTPEERVFRARMLASSEDPPLDPLADAALARTLSTLLSYRPGVASYPRDIFHVEDALAALPVEVLRYLATGAWNLHRKIEEVHAEARAERERLLDTLHLDHTGLAKALEEVRFEARARLWIVDGRGSYEWDDERYKREAGLALEAVIKRASRALIASGNLAHAHCCGRQSVAKNVARLKEAPRGK